MSEGSLELVELICCRSAPLVSVSLFDFDERQRGEIND